MSFLNKFRKQDSESQDSQSSESAPSKSPSRRRGGGSSSQSRSKPDNRDASKGAQSSGRRASSKSTNQGGTRRGHTRKASTGTKVKRRYPAEAVKAEAEKKEPVTKAPANRAAAAATERTPWWRRLWPWGAAQREEEVGKVVHYFSRAKAGVIRLTKGPLTQGDTIHITGRTTDIQQRVDELQVNRKAVSEVRKGQSVGVKVKARVRPGDRVFVVKRG